VGCSAGAVGYPTGCCYCCYCQDIYSGNGNSDSGDDDDFSYEDE